MKEHNFVLQAKEQKQDEKEEGTDGNNRKKNNHPKPKDGIQEKIKERKWSEGWSNLVKENNNCAWKNLSYRDNSVVTTKFPT